MIRMPNIDNLNERSLVREVKALILKIISERKPIGIWKVLQRRKIILISFKGIS